MTFTKSRFAAPTALIVLFAAASGSLQAQHVHLTAGALTTTPGSPLSFVNDTNTFAASSGVVFNMVLRTNGTLAGLYDGGPTFTAAGSDGFDGSPAAPGAQLVLIVKSLAGPEGGAWGFWESLECDDFGTNLTFSLPVGATNGTNRFLISQNTGAPGEDPYGHCHGRRFTTTQPGLYTLGVQIVDVSRNGPGGAPLHTPSPIYRIHFQAGFTIARATTTNNTFEATFGTRTGSRFYLEANSLLDGSLPWTTVAGPVTGNNRLQTLKDPAALAEPGRFYRLRVTTP